jgi:hypothetical protein
MNYRVCIPGLYQRFYRDNRDCHKRNAWLWGLKITQLLLGCLSLLVRVFAVGQSWGMAAEVL